jgi:hypothetical protein
LTGFLGFILAHLENTTNHGENVLLAGFERSTQNMSGRGEYQTLLPSRVSTAPISLVVDNMIREIRKGLEDIVVEDDWRGWVVGVVSPKTRWIILNNTL